MLEFARGLNQQRKAGPAIAERFGAAVPNAPTEFEKKLYADAQLNKYKRMRLSQQLGAEPAVKQESLLSNLINNIGEHLTKTTEHSRQALETMENMGLV